MRNRESARVPGSKTRIARRTIYKYNSVLIIIPQDILAYPSPVGGIKVPMRLHLHRHFGYEVYPSMIVPLRDTLPHSCRSFSLHSAPIEQSAMASSKPLLSIFLAAFTSRSSINPQNGQTCVRIDRDFSIYAPQPEHFCDV